MVKRRREQHQPIRATMAGNRVSLRLEENAGPGTFLKHEAFAVTYRRISEEYRPPLALTVYGGRKKDGQLVIAELAAPREGLTENDLNELAHLSFYFWPNGNRNPKHEKVCRPASMWLFRGGKMLVACLNGTKKTWLAEWLEEARKERPDPQLYAVASEYRRAGRPVSLSHKRKSAAWRAGAPEKPLQSFYPFRGESALQPPTRRPAGVLASAGAGVSSRSRPEPPVEATKNNTVRLDLPERSELHRLGYKIGGLSRRERWRILTEEAVPRLGLEKVVRTIANHRRRALSQSGGATRYAYAIGEWEHDLARLKREVYPNHRPRFAWPRSEP